jgi:hypothetical protein
MYAYAVDFKVSAKFHSTTVCLGLGPKMLSAIPVSHIDRDVSRKACTECHQVASRFHKTRANHDITCSNLAIVKSATPVYSEGLAIMRVTMRL